MTRNIVLYAIIALVLLAIGLYQSWNLAFNILNLCLISAIMALGVNIQWGYAGLFNVGIVGFTALGGLAAVLVAAPPVPDAWAVGGTGILFSFLGLVGTVVAILVARRLVPAYLKTTVTVVLAVLGFFAIRIVYLPAVDRIEDVNPAFAGYLGGMNLPILLSWGVGGLVAAGAAWFIGKVALGLRADYLAIATLGIGEIIIAMLKYEDWLTRGVKNVTGLPRPVPYEVSLVKHQWFIDFAHGFGATDTTLAASLFVKICYTVLFVIVIGIVMWFSERALRSPWGRMMRAIRDNRDAANAMGKDVTRRHLQVFILGCAVCGVAGAMLTTMNGQFTPVSYLPLRFTFLIWVMVILGGSGNNWGAVLGGFIIWFLWIEASPFGQWTMELLTAPLNDDYWLKQHLIDAAAYTRYLLMGAILLLVMRFAPQGLIPERSIHAHSDRQRRESSRGASVKQGQNSGDNDQV